MDSNKVPRDFESGEGKSREIHQEFFVSLKFSLSQERGVCDAGTDDPDRPVPWPMPSGAKKLCSETCVWLGDALQLPRLDSSNADVVQW